MTLSNEERDFYNQQLRAKFSEYNSVIQDEIITILQSTFRIADRRNVEYWLTDRYATRRNFINKSVGEMELEARLNFVKSFLANKPTPVIKKTGIIAEESYKKTGDKLRKYLVDRNFINRSTRLEFFVGGGVEYDIDISSPAEEDERDEDTISDEFADLIEP